MLILITLFSISLCMNPYGGQMNVFYAKGGNLFADFFNVELFISEKDPYNNTLGGVSEHCYPPLAYAFLYIFHGFYDYQNTTYFEDCLESKEALLSCVMFMLFSTLVFLHSLSRLFRIPFVGYLAILGSSIFLFTFERGNIVLLTIAFVFYFFAYKDSSQTWMRTFALLCLSISAVIKIYPAIFGLYLLKEKRYKDIYFCIVLSSILFFFPFLFFKGGLGNFPLLLSNLSSFKEHYDSIVVGAIIPRFSLSDTPVNIARLIQLQSQSIVCVNTFFRGLAFILSSLSIIAFFFEKEPWKRYSLLALALLYLPEHSVWYCGLYYIPAIFLFLQKQDFSKMDWTYMICFCILLNPLQIVVNILGSERTLTCFLSNLSLCAIWFFVLTQSYTQVIQSTSNSLKKNTRRVIVQHKL